MGAILANDTSCGAGYASERHLNHIKVMGVRYDRDVHLTVAVAFIWHNANDYLVKKASMCSAARAVARAALDQETLVELYAANVPPGSLYLTVTGTSAEAGMMARQAVATGPRA